jgi:DNA-binding NarL/FixJ family response regulator
MGGTLKGTMSQLTTREKDVLDLLVRGLSNKQIGSVLLISRKTVEKHVAAIFLKLEVHSRTEAAVFAVRQGLLSRDE